MAGIKETKEALKFIIELGEGVEKSMADGKFDFWDIVDFYKALSAAGPAFKDIEMVAKELIDLDEAEVEELKAFVEAELDLEHDAVEAVIEKGLGVILSLIKYLSIFKK